MSAETIRVITKSKARSDALVAALDGVGGETFAEHGVHEVRISPDAATTASLTHMFHAVGEWLAYGKEGSCEIHFGDRALTVVAPNHGKPNDATRFLLERTVQLQSALESRIVIEQAKGMLAERLDVSLEEAFAFLRSAARSQGVKLERLASEVVRSPETPPEVARLSERQPK